MADGYLTTHVLDTALGKPAVGIDVTLYRIEGGARIKIAGMTTNTDGRTDAPILPKTGFAPGQYELVFAAGDYIARTTDAVDGPPFLDEIPIRFGIADANSHYHVPLLLSPYGYSTYRGS